jgi:hypothetical protein
LAEVPRQLLEVPVCHARVHVVLERLLLHLLPRPASTTSISGNAMGRGYRAASWSRGIGSGLGEAKEPYLVAAEDSRAPRGAEEVSAAGAAAAHQKPV